MHVDWSAVFALDSDHDTFANGIELGDPDGAWQIGDPSPAGTTYNPGDPESHPSGSCNNGVVEPDEDCEPALPLTTTCGELGYDGGTVACMPGCDLDLSGCAGFQPDGGIGGSDGDAVDADGADAGGCATEAGGGAGPAGAAVALTVMLGALVARARRTRARGVARPRGR
jgi:hypothetical protein